MASFEDSRTQRANGMFIRKSMRAPLLGPEQEHNLAVRWRKRGDEEALHELVAAYTRLAVSIALRFRSYGLPISELIQEGNIGMMQAAARFDPDRGVRFSTYATWWIRSSVQDYILRNWSIVRTGTTTAQKSLFFNLRRLQAKIDGNDRKSRQMRIADELRVSLSDVATMEQRLSGADQSLNAPLTENGQDELQEFIVDERPNPEHVVTGMRDAEARSRWLAEALAELSPREQTIIQERRLREQGATLEELGRKLGLSKERVRQLENRALSKLRKEMIRHVERPSDLYAFQSY